MSTPTTTKKVNNSSKIRKDGKEMNEWMKRMWGIRRGNKVILEGIQVIYRIITEKNINIKKERETANLYLIYHKRSKACKYVY